MGVIEFKSNDRVRLRDEYVRNALERSIQPKALARRGTVLRGDEKQRQSTVEVQWDDLDRPSVMSRGVLEVVPREPASARPIAPGDRVRFTDSFSACWGQAFPEWKSHTIGQVLAGEVPGHPDCVTVDWDLPRVAIFPVHISLLERVEEP